MITEITDELQERINKATNPEGMVYIKYRYSQGRVKVGDITYYFSKRKGVCLGLVQPNDVLSVLNFKGGCCGRKERGVYTVASPAEIALWRSYEEQLQVVSR